MSEVFVISDTHFGHQNILKFLNEDGSRVRPHWEDVDSMNEDMVNRWNNVVSPSDKVIHLGDVVINRRRLPILNRLNGKKELVLGNHDLFGYEDYTKYFRKLHGSLKMGDLVLSHIPIHPEELPAWSIGCLHGHVHCKSLKDSRYVNACVEVNNYTPVHIEVFRNSLKTMT